MNEAKTCYMRLEAGVNPGSVTMQTNGQSTSLALAPLGRSGAPVSPIAGAVARGYHRRLPPLILALNRDRFARFAMRAMPDKASERRRATAVNAQRPQHTAPPRGGPVDIAVCACLPSSSRLELHPLTPDRSTRSAPYRMPRSELSLPCITADLAGQAANQSGHLA